MPKVFIVLNNNSTKLKALISHTDLTPEATKCIG